MNIDFKKLYYYIICLITFFVLMWGMVDLVSASMSLATFKVLPVISAEKEIDPNFEAYYQKRMSLDRIMDALSRMLVSGAIFAYGKMRLKKLEGEKA